MCVLVVVVMCGHCSRSPSLLVYNLTDEGKLVLCCTTEMAAEICHFDFHPIDNTLWVLLGCEENPIINLEWTGNEVSMFNTLDHQWYVCLYFIVILTALHAFCANI